MHFCINWFEGQVINIHSNLAENNTKLKNWFLNLFNFENLSPFLIKVFCASSIVEKIDNQAMIALFGDLRDLLKIFLISCPCESSSCELASYFCGLHLLVSFNSR